MSRCKLRVEPLECESLPLSELEDAVKEIIAAPLPNDQHSENWEPTQAEREQRFKRERRSSFPLQLLLHNSLVPQGMKMKATLPVTSFRTNAPFRHSRQFNGNPGHFVFLLPWPALQQKHWTPACAGTTDSGHFRAGSHACAINRRHQTRPDRTRPVLIQRGRPTLV